MEKTENRESEEIEIDLLDLLKALLRKWYLLILMAVILGGAGYGYSKYMITPMYQSTSELYVLSKSTSITSVADVQLGTSLTQDYIVVVTGRPVLEQVIKNLGLNMSYGALRGKVGVSNPSNSRILQITVTDANPEQAKLLADEIADVSARFIAEKMSQDPPTVIQYGYSDGGPVSPNVKKNTLVGAAIGVFVMAVLIVLIHMFDDKIRTVEDVEQKLGINVLGTLPLVKSEDDGEKPSKKKKQSA